MIDTSPAAERNRAPIGDVLERVLPKSGLVLEIASGGGEHTAYFAERFPALEWQPTDKDKAAGDLMIARFAENPRDNIREPKALDASLSQWPVRQADAMICINMVHICPWGCTVGLFAGAERVLPARAPLVLYGPYREEGVETAPSNLDFHESLKARDPRWGLRRLEEVDKLAHKHGFERTRREEMPANNLTLVYRKRA